MQIIPPRPRKVPGSTAQLSDQLTISILIDRSLFLEVGKSVLLILNAEEATALFVYLKHHSKKFEGGQQ